MLAILKSFLFGLSLVLAFVLGNFLLWKKTKAKDISSETVFDLSLVSLICGLISGRLFYILANWQVFQIDIFRWIHVVRYPGFSGKAVMVGFLLTLLYLCRKRKIYPWLFLDCLVVPFIYALALGQLGCLINECVVGTMTKFHFRHPLGLYAIIGTLILMLVVKKLETYLPQIISRFHKEKKWEVRSEGLLFIFVLSLYSVIDFVLELFRENALYLENVKLGLVFDLLLLFFGFLLLFIRLGNNFVKKNYDKV